MRYTTALAIVALIACLPAVLGGSCIATLYAKDDIRGSMEFRTGSFGSVVQNWDIYNYDSQLAFGFNGVRRITIAPQGGQNGYVAELTDQVNSNCRTRYPSVRFQNNNLVCDKDYNGPTVPLNVTWTGAFTQTAIPGNIYLFKVEDYSRNWSLVTRAKILDINDYALTIRWDVLQDTRNPDGTPSGPCAVSPNVSERAVEYQCDPATTPFKCAIVP